MATKLDLALAQFVGFRYGKWNRDDVLGLVKGMGLKKKEWSKLKKENIDTFLEKSEIKEINEYFKKIKR